MGEIIVVLLKPVVTYQKMFWKLLMKFLNAWRLFRNYELFKSLKKIKTLFTCSKNGLTFREFVLMLLNIESC